MPRIRWYGPSLVLLAAVLLVMVQGPRLVRQIAFADEEARIEAVRHELRNNAQLLEVSESFRDVARAVRPSVVHVSVLSRLPGSAYNRSEENSNGSGWVFDDQGHIVTNQHVVAGAQELRVRFADGSEHRAELVGSDPKTDVAVIRVLDTLVHPAARALEPVQQGDIVFAFGSPFRDFDFSMSQGIVSATERRVGITGLNGYENLIQTDAAINPGNSGGPLTNVFGEVVGMNTAIATRGSESPNNGTFLGVGFAIPVDMAVDIAEQLITQGEVRRGYLGIGLAEDDLTPAMARTFGFEGRGVLIDSVAPNGVPGPAADAGLKPGDIITHIDGTPTPTIASLRNLIAGFSPETDVEVTFFRMGTTRDVTVTLSELPSNTQFSAPSNPREREPGRDGRSDSPDVDLLNRLGILDYETFTQSRANELGTRYESGVLITRVRRGSIAEAQLAFRRDPSVPVLVTHVFDQPILNSQMFREQLQEHDLRQGVRLTRQHWNPAARQWVTSFVLLNLDTN